MPRWFTALLFAVALSRLAGALGFSVTLHVVLTVLGIIPLAGSARLFALSRWTANGAETVGTCWSRAVHVGGGTGMVSWVDSESPT